MIHHHLFKSSVDPPYIETISPITAAPTAAYQQRPCLPATPDVVELFELAPLLELLPLPPDEPVSRGQLLLHH